MKGKTKTQKGITLIALIITIVVLLILAAVAISSITNDGILQYAQNAAGSWNQAQVNEQSMLNGYMNYLNNGGSTQVTIISFTIDGTTYQAEEGMTWAEWVESEYNVVSAYVHTTANGIMFKSVYDYVFVTYADGSYARATDLVTNNYQYDIET